MVVSQPGSDGCFAAFPLKSGTSQIHTERTARYRPNPATRTALGASPKRSFVTRPGLGPGWKVAPSAV